MKKFLLFLLMLALVAGAAFSGYFLGSSVGSGAEGTESAFSGEVPLWMTDGGSTNYSMLRSAKGSYPYFDDPYYDALIEAYASAEAVNIIIDSFYGELKEGNAEDEELLGRISGIVRDLAYKNEECILDGEYWVLMSVETEAVMEEMGEADEEGYDSIENLFDKYFL